jgi:hypothetical protein
MSSNETFTILSVGASLVEVDGSGPTTDRPSGLDVPDGVPVTAPVHLLTEFVRRFRVDAAPSVQATVTITDSPFGVFVGVRRCVPLARKAPWWRFLAVTRWPRMRGAIKRVSPSLLALWYVLTDEAPPAAPSTTNGARAHDALAPTAKLCAWQDVGGDDITNQVTAHGGDLVVVTFVTP